LVAGWYEGFGGLHISALLWWEYQDTSTLKRFKNVGLVRKKRPSMVHPHQQQPEEFFVTGDPSVVFHKSFYHIQINPRTGFISTIEHLSEGTKDAP
jgi:hypothetical protein